jgi:pyruvate formate lyase activating enzyme
MGQDSRPEETLAQAIQFASKSIAYTYTEPTIFLEYAYDVAQLAHDQHIKNVFITNGFITSEALQTIAPYLDAVNVDLKSFSNDFYKRICKAKLKPVLETLEILNQLGIWTEVTTLVIPGFNDTEQEFYAIAEFIMNISREIPWHISAFHPAYKLKYLPPTPLEVLNRAREIGLKTGLHYVYSGNATNHGAADTRCPDCGQILIERTNFEILKNKIRNGYCPNCGKGIAGAGMSNDRNRIVC